MTFDLTPEQRAALAMQPDGVLRLLDRNAGKAYLVIAEEKAPSLGEMYFRSKLAEADLAAQAGNTGTWDPAIVKAEGWRRRINALQARRSN